MSEPMRPSKEAMEAVNLQSICDRLNDVFNEDDTPDDLSQNAAFTIEMLWQERDAQRATIEGLQNELETERMRHDFASARAALAQAKGVMEE